MAGNDLLLLIAHDTAFREALEGFLSAPGRSISAVRDMASAIRIASERKPYLVFISCECRDIAQIFPEIEAWFPGSLVVLLRSPEGGREPSIPPPSPGGGEIAPAAPEGAHLCFERGSDLDSDRRRLFPALLRLVSGEEERLKLLEENRKLREELERASAGIDAKIKQRTANLSEKIEELTNLNHMKSEFLSLISHKMRTPLTAIIGFAEILSNRLESEEDREQMVLSILRSAMDLGNFLNDAVEFIQRASGSISLQKTAFDVVPHLQRVLRDRSKLYASKRIRLVYRGLTAFKLQGDPRSLASAIDRVVDNAFKYSVPGGTVEIGLHEENRPGHQRPVLVLKIRDYGIGLDRLQLEKLFKPMEIYSSDADRTLGHGLGLAIAQEVIHSHGGRIFVQSDGPERGCLVTIELLTHPPATERGDRIPLKEIASED